MLAEILLILAIAAVAMVGAYLKSREVRAATQNRPEPEDQERDVSR